MCRAHRSSPFVYKACKVREDNSRAGSRKEPSRQFPCLLLFQQVEVLSIHELLLYLERHLKLDRSPDDDDDDDDDEEAGSIPSCLRFCMSTRFLKLQASRSRLNRGPSSPATTSKDKKRW